MPNTVNELLGVRSTGANRLDRTEPSAQHVALCYIEHHEGERVNSRLFSSLRALIRPGHRSSYYQTPRHYWDQRHRDAGTSLNGVGFKGLGQDDNTRDYDEKWRQLRAILDELAGDKPVTLLDAGCGIGWFSSRLADAGFDVDGVDFSAEAIAIARQNHANSAIHWQVGDLHQFHSTRPYDIVMCIDVLFHVVEDERWRASVRNLASLATGHLVIQEELTTRQKPMSDPSKTHVHRRMLDDYLEVLSSDWTLEVHRSYPLPIQGTNKDILVFERSADSRG